MLNKDGFAALVSNLPNGSTEVAPAGPSPAETSFEDLVTDLTASFVGVEPAGASGVLAATGRWRGEGGPLTRSGRVRVNLGGGASPPEET